MNCPGCSAENNINAKFCLCCGYDLRLRTSCYNYFENWSKDINFLVNPEILPEESIFENIQDDLLNNFQVDIDLLKIQNEIINLRNEKVIATFKTAYPVFKGYDNIFQNPKHLYLFYENKVNYELIKALCRIHKKKYESIINQIENIKNEDRIKNKNAVSFAEYIPENDKESMGCIIFILGLVLAPICIGVPVLIYGIILMFSGNKAYYKGACPYCNTPQKAITNKGFLGSRTKLINEKETIINYTGFKCFTCGNKYYLNDDKFYTKTALENI